VRSERVLRSEKNGDGAGICRVVWKVGVRAMVRVMVKVMAMMKRPDRQPWSLSTLLIWLVVYENGCF